MVVGFCTYLKAALERRADDRRLRADNHLVKLELAILADHLEVAVLSGLQQMHKNGMRLGRHRCELSVRLLRLSVVWCEDAEIRSCR